MVGYKVIKIGNELLTNVGVPKALNSFLRVGDTYTFHLVGGRLMGLQLGDGSFYCPKPKTGLWVFCVVLGIPLCFAVIGIPMVLLGLIRLFAEGPMRELQRKGATALAQ
jgi:hypothetical protein